ncbi:TonB-dependent receptor [Hydrotalea sp.]|uniref:TonB-dependent receptor n=1 Tax=Hydrotalea sp. TaxID=2881279 RepID=UPI003D0B74CB
MRLLKSLLSVMVSTCITVTVFAQHTYSGKVTDSKGQPLEGVTITIKGTSTSTATNAQGQFTLKGADNAVLEISSVGFETRTIKGGSSMSIVLKESVANLGDVVMVGSRGAGRSKTESPVPVDIIKLGTANNTTARMDLTSALNYLAPSFNYNKQSGGDGSDAIDLATLRGLGPDQTLVLINGKRQHQTAFVALFGTRGRGASGTDLNAIPIDAIDRVEILRDGASAQYGSDAIAGVINIVLKKDVNHLSINTGWSGYYDHKYNSLNGFDPSQYYTGHQVDGNTVSVGMNYGLPVGKNGGYINFSGDFRSAGKTFREVPDTNVMTNPKALPINTIRRAFGDASVLAAGGMFNMEIPIAHTNTSFYSFGGYNYKNSNAYAYTRNFSAAPERFPTDANGNLIFVPGIMKKTADGSETYYNPIEDVHITDYENATGFKGTFKSGWNWDISNTIGYNNFHYFGQKTFNASFNPANVNKTNFDDGGFNFLQNTVNAGINKNISKGFNLAFGAEYRYENYKIYQGEEASYALYDPNKAAGAQGFPGFQPADVVNANRSVIAGYADAAIDVTKQWLIDVAVRAENYTDFGGVATYKLATRYKVSHNFNLRGSVSTGFRAPSLQQINFSNTQTNILGGKLVATRIVPNYSPLARVAGIPPLTPEKSVNASLGFSWKPAPELTITTDGYLVNIKNRVVLSGQFSADDNTLPAGLINALNNLNVAAAQFFANAVSTTNTGLDVVIDYNKKIGKSNFKATLAGNFNHITINSINVPDVLNTSYLHQQTFYSTREQSFLMASAPKSKFSLGLDYSRNKVGAGVHFTYFGQLTTQGYGYSGSPNPIPNGPGDPNISGSGNGYDPYVTTDNGSTTVPENFLFHGKVTTDIYGSYKISKSVTLFGGIDNLFNVHPDLSAVPNARYASAYDSESGGPFDAIQMGFDGMRMFVKLAFNF